jgi:signal transduction histidine kinase
MAETALREREAHDGLWGRRSDGYHRFPDQDLPAGHAAARPRRAESEGPGAWLAPACVGAVLLIGLLDHTAGISLTLAPFYLLPISAVAWYRGRAAGVALSVLGTLCSLAGDLTHGGAAGTLVPYWNAAARLPVLIFVVMLLVRVQEAVERQRLAAQAHRETAQAIRSADAMKTAFLSAAAHDLRTPLTTLLGNALTLEQMGDGLGSQARGELVSTMVRSGRNLERLLNELLDLERLQANGSRTTREPLFLPSLVDRVVSEVGVAETHPVTIEVEAAHASLDRVMVERLLANLLLNAERHLAPGTQVWVKVHRVEGQVSIRVEDAGPGIPEHLRASIFEPFRHGEGSRRDGMGIGLSLVARFAQLHGGRAWVEEREGGGASFRISLPEGHDPSAESR